MTSSSAEVTAEAASSREPTAATPGARKRHATDLGIIPIPSRLVYDPSKPFTFSLVLNIAFGFTSTIMVANLYWCQPLLIQLSEAFKAPYSDVSRIPTLLQAGYAVGLLFISPLGDLVRRRQLILSLIALAASMSIGLAITNSLVVFETLSFLVGIASVVPNILIPLAADLAPPERQTTAIAVVLSGLLFGTLLSRVLAGVVAQFSSWRVVYYLAVGVQYLVLAGGYSMIPDYPPRNLNLSYWDILRTMAKSAVTEPILIQASLVSLGASACYTSFWVTLTFLLGGPPYNYSTLVIGLFGLVGMAGVAVAPLIARYTENVVPWYCALIAILFMTLGQVVQVSAGGINVSAVIIAAFILSIFRQMLQVSLATAIFGISVSARARLNALLVISIFIGQVLGTAAGAHVFLEHGWRACAALSMGWFGWQLLILLLRGPHCEPFVWYGYRGGLRIWKQKKETRSSVSQERSDVEKNKVDQNSKL